MNLVNMSPIWILSKNEFKNLIDNSNSISEILQTLGLSPYAGNYSTFHQRIKKDSIDISELLKKGKKSKTSKKYWKISKEIFIERLKENSSVHRGDIKKKIIEFDLIPSDKCAECQLSAIWNNKSLTLQLDHINGIHNDNRLENLRFICPNCHSQTDTFSGKQKRILQKADRTLREKLPKIPKYRISWPTIEIIKEDVFTYPMYKLCELYKCSDRAIKKHCIKLNIKLPPKRYFLRKLATPTRIELA